MRGKGGGEGGEGGEGRGSCGTANHKIVVCWVCNAFVQLLMRWESTDVSLLLEFRGVCCAADEVFRTVLCECEGGWAGVVFDVILHIFCESVKHRPYVAN